jgi:hypothetical protein
MQELHFKSALLTLVVILNLILQGYSIGDETQIGAREVALGNSSVALVSVFSAFNNQAALARIGRFTTALDYQQPFRINGYSQKSLALVIPLKLANFGVSLKQKGILNYNETRMGLALARNFGPGFSAGIQFNYFMMDFPEQGSQRGTFLIECGILYEVTNNLLIGVHLFNPAHATIESLNLKAILPLRLTTGFSIKPSSSFLLSSAFDYSSEIPFQICFGIEYQLAHRFFLRCGVSGKPIRHAVGLGYKYKFLAFDFALLHHDNLGYTPSICLTLNL